MQDIRVRSPFIVRNTLTNFPFDTSTFEIRAWTGGLTADYPVSPTYTKTKQKINSLQTQVYVNASNLLKEDLEANPTLYVAPGSTVAAQTYFIGDKESKFCEIKQTWTNGATGSTGATQTDSFFILDGWIDSTESQGDVDVLLSSDSNHIYRQFATGATSRIHFKKDNLSSISVTDSYGTSTISLTGSSTISNQYIQSIVTPTTEPSSLITFTYSSPTRSYYVHVNCTDNCIYDNWNVIFKNKFGVLETISFNKKHSSSISITNQDYKRSLVDYNGDFDNTLHISKQFNVVGLEEVTLNTDYLPEYMNQTIKELLLSEQIWAYVKGILIPLTLSDKSWTKKTRLNDKLIQYTMKFKYSQESINNII